MAALRTGVDLATVYCAEEAATPLKCYSPELMVQPVYCARTFAGVSSPLSPPSSQQQEMQEHQEEQQRVAMMIDAMVLTVAEYIDSMHCLLIGPGLGRSPPVLTAVRRIIGLAMEKKKYLVLDADALVLLSSTTTTTSMLDEMTMILLRNYDRVVLTPNAAEYRRLETAGVFADDRPVLSPIAIVVQKGRHDVVTTTDGRETIQCTEIGGMKRPGGLGDVLAGTIAALVAWQAILLGDEGEGVVGEEQKTGDLALACWTACCIVKRATARAYERNGRAMSAQNVLDEIGPVFWEMVE
jgi:ATP-dependent NAD(P)H-hydrate dehydratase